jgi:hypothetical protein
LASALSAHKRSALSQPYPKEEFAAATQMKDKIQASLAEINKEHKNGVTSTGLLSRLELRHKKTAQSAGLPAPESHLLLVSPVGVFLKRVQTPNPLRQSPRHKNLQETHHFLESLEILPLIHRQKFEYSYTKTKQVENHTFEQPSALLHQTS